MNGGGWAGRGGRKSRGQDAYYLAMVRDGAGAPPHHEVSFEEMLDIALPNLSLRSRALARRLEGWPQARHSSFSRRDAPEFCKFVSPAETRGRRKRRVRGAPAVPREYW